MNISSPFIHRPVATSLLALAALLGGMMGYLGLPVSALPQVDFPTIEITTQLPGANPDTVAALLTGPLERQMGQIPALAQMTSTSTFAISRITLQFDLTRDIDAAAQDVQAAINAAGSTLPRALPYPPTYAKVNPADAPILSLALTSDTVPLRALSDMADTLLGQKLSQVSGVGHVVLQGGVRPAVRIQADLSRLSATGLGLEDLRSAIVGANVAGSKGSLDGNGQSWTIATNDQISAASAYRNVVVAYRNGAPILLKDMADIVEGLENSKVGAFYQSKQAVILDIQRQPGANVVETVANIRAQLPLLERSLPASASLSIVQDRTGTIQASIHDVQFTLLLSVMLVVLVVFLFLRSVRATIIAGVALPLSLVATFGIMLQAGFSLDNLSLMALTIGTGFVVDDAIVMIENITRHIEEGDSPLAAALKGAREIGFTIVSLTLSLVAVFIPLLFMSGIVGRMFREFALTLTIAVVVSAIVSLTLTPMMCAWLMRAKRRDGKARASRIDALIETVTQAYGRSLERILRHETLMLGATFATLALTILLYTIAPKGFLPQQDTGIITASTQADPTISFDRMQVMQAKVADMIRADPDVSGVVSVIGVGTLNPTPNAGSLTIVLKSRTLRTAGADAIITRLGEKSAKIAGITTTYQSSQDVQVTTRVSRARYQYILTGTDNGEVSLWANRLAKRLGQSDLVRDVGSEAQEGGLRLFVNVDREKAGSLGVSMQAISDTLNDAFGQRQVSTIYGQANQYRVILEAKPSYQADTATLALLYVTGAGGAQVPLSAIARMEYQTSALVIGRQAQFPAETVSFNLADGASLSDIVTELRQASDDIGLPASISGVFSGDTAEFSRSLAGQPWLVLAAVITIYIVLGVLYESAVHPLTILSTLPSAGVGALLALQLTGHDLSLVAMIGIILLMGIVKKNAIMMIDFALEAEREEGLDPRSAIIKASIMRFRPIMMTTLAALFGALPLAVESGTGSELRNPLGIAIVGGLLLSQLLTLYTTPVIYLALERARQKLFPSRAPAGVLEPDGKEGLA